MATEFKIVGVDKISGTAAQFKAAKAKFHDVLLREAMGFANDAVTRIKRDYLSGPRPDKLGVGTGNLRSKIRYEIGESGNIVAVTVGTDVPYAAAHEFGRAPYTIVPKKANILSFLIGGKRVFARKVDHPGLRPRPFLEPGFKDALPDFKDNLESGLKAIASGEDDGK